MNHSILLILVQMAAAAKLNWTTLNNYGVGEFTVDPTTKEGNARVDFDNHGVGFVYDVIGLGFGLHSISGNDEPPTDGVPLDEYVANKKFDYASWNRNFEALEQDGFDPDYYGKAGYHISDIVIE